MSPVWAAIGAVALASAGHRLRWLTDDGLFAAVLVGTGVLIGAAASGAVLLGTFFVTGSVLTRWNAPSRRPSGDAARDAAQVLANGWTALLGSLAIPLAPQTGWPILLGGLAAAQADTWATEIGVRARRAPLLISTFRSVPVGTSGGVTVLGTAGGVSGAVLMAALGMATGAASWVAAGALVGGIAGMMCDSWLGATVQRQYHCDACDEASPTAIHACGAPARHADGAKWITNDVVNAVASGMGATVSLALARAAG